MTVGATVLARPARLPEAVEGAGALARPSCPGPSSLTRSSTQSPRSRGDDPDRAALGRDLERVVEQVVDDLLEPTRRRTRRGRALDVGARCARASRRRTRPTRRSRPSITCVDRDRRRRRRRLLGACEHEQPVDQAREPRHLRERAVEVLGGGAAARRPRGSRAAGASPRAACAAGATRRRRTPAARRRAARAAPRWR